MFLHRGLDILRMDKFSCHDCYCCLTNHKDQDAKRIFRRCTGLLLLNQRISYLAPTFATMQNDSSLIRAYRNVR